MYYGKRKCVDVFVSTFIFVSEIGLEKILTALPLLKKSVTFSIAKAQAQWHTSYVTFLPRLGLLLWKAAQTK